MNSLDTMLQIYLASSRTSVMTEFMYVLTTIFDLALPFVLIALCVAILVYIIRGKKHAVQFGLSLFIGAILIFFLKSYFNIGRPMDSVITAFGQSFPSYHATIVTIFFGMLMYLFDDYFGKISRIIFNSFCFFIILMVSYSRLYLGAHWLSDVLGGIVLGTIVCYLSIKIYDLTFRKNSQGYTS
ncbi:MAG: phosphatase PAP2 family protein [bacterium]